MPFATLGSRVCGAAATAALALAAPAARAQYAFTRLDPAGSTETTIYGVNNAGESVGYYRDAVGTYHAFRSRGGAITALDYPGATSSFASGINNVGQIVGDYGSASEHHAFVYSASTGTFSIFDVPTSFGASTSGWGINDLGQIVGHYFAADGTRSSYLDDGGVFSKLLVPGSTSTAVSGINNAGQIVGSYYTATSVQAFLYANGMYTTLQVPGARYALATGINNLGQIVGWYVDPDGNEHGFLNVGGVYQSIDGPAGFYYDTELNGINDAGQLVGESYDPNAAYFSGIVSTTATAAPEPASFALVAVGFGTIAAVARRRHRA